MSMSYTVRASDLSSMIYRPCQTSVLRLNFPVDQEMDVITHEHMGIEAERTPRYFLKSDRSLKAFCFGSLGDDVIQGGHCILSGAFVP